MEKVKWWLIEKCEGSWSTCVIQLVECFPKCHIPNYNFFLPFWLLRLNWDSCDSDVNIVPCHPPRKSWDIWCNPPVWPGEWSALNPWLTWTELSHQTQFETSETSLHCNYNFLTELKVSIRHLSDMSSQWHNVISVT